MTDLGTVSKAAQSLHIAQSALGVSNFSIGLRTCTLLTAEHVRFSEALALA